MGYRVPLVLSGIPLLPGESPQPLSVDGTASGVKGGGAWRACACVDAAAGSRPSSSPQETRHGHTVASVDTFVFVVTWNWLRPRQVEPKPLNGFYLKSLLYRQQITLLTTWYSPLFYCQCIYTEINILKKCPTEVGTAAKQEKSDNVPSVVFIPDWEVKCFLFSPQALQDFKPSPDKEHTLLERIISAY